MKYSHSFKKIIVNISCGNGENWKTHVTLFHDITKTVRKLHIYLTSETMMQMLFEI